MHDQHDHVTFAKAWMLLSKGVAHAVDYDFRLVPQAVMAPLQRRLEGGLRQTELPWERAKLPTCFGGLGIRVARMGFAAQATYWMAVMTNMCEALNRPIRELHPEIATALAARTDLLLSGVAVSEHARATIESEASQLYEASPWPADKRAAEIVRPALVQTADRVPPKSLAPDMAFA